MNDKIKLTLVVTNTELKSRHALECELDKGCLTLVKKDFTKEYGKHVLGAVYDLLQHPSFRKTKEKSLIIAP
jgi:hypothetical protein